MSSIGLMPINDMLLAIVKFIVSFINILLYPVDMIIQNFLPDLSNIFTAIGNYLSIIASSIGWVISLSGLSSGTISLVILYYIFKLSAPLVFYFIKMAVQWYDKLKL